MKYYSRAIYALVLAIFLGACNDPTPLGSELLQDDQVEIFFTDTVSFITTTVREDSVVAFNPDPSVTNSTFLMGDFNDPVYGKTLASIYAQIIPNFDEPQYEGAIIDSVVLILDYDSIATYGNLEAEPFGIGVYRITESLNREDETYYSDQVFSYNDAMPLAEINSFIPQTASQDSVFGLIDYTFNTDGDTIDVRTHLRVRLDNSIGEEFADYDSIIHTSGSEFVELFNGLHIRPLTETSSMLAFDLSSNSISTLSVFYRQDTVNRQYNYSFSTRYVQLNNFEIDRSGTNIENIFDDTTIGDSILFLQAMSGPNVKIVFPNTDIFEDVIINKAELKFTVAELEDDDLITYPPTISLIAADVDDEGFIFVQDVLEGGSAFGGVIQEEIDADENAIQTYQMNISAHFQEIVDERRPNEIFLRVFPKQEQSSRTIIHGPGHSKYPMELKITYTKL